MVGSGVSQVVVDQSQTPAFVFSAKEALALVEEKEHN